MATLEILDSASLIQAPRPAATPKSPWAIVLAGGEGQRLRSLTRHVCGDDRPKQFVPLLGPRSLLRRTLDRIGLGIPLTRTVLVTHARDAGYLAREFAIQAAGSAPRAPAPGNTGMNGSDGRHATSQRD
jgi:hypothetical protein